MIIAKMNTKKMKSFRGCGGRDEATRRPPHSVSGDLPLRSRGRPLSQPQSGRSRRLREGHSADTVTGAVDVWHDLPDQDDEHLLEHTNRPGADPAGV